MRARSTAHRLSCCWRVLIHGLGCRLHCSLCRGCRCSCCLNCRRLRLSSLLRRLLWLLTFLLLVCRCTCSLGLNHPQSMLDHHPMCSTPANVLEKERLQLTFGASSLDWVHSATVSLMKTLRFFSGTPNFSSARTPQSSMPWLHLSTSRKALGADDERPYPTWSWPFALLEVLWHVHAMGAQCTIIAMHCC